MKVGAAVVAEAGEEIETGEEEVDVQAEVKALKIALKQNEDLFKINGNIGQDMIPQILVVGIERDQEGINYI